MGICESCQACIVLFWHKQAVPLFQGYSSAPQWRMTAKDKTVANSTAYNIPIVADNTPVNDVWCVMTPLTTCNRQITLNQFSKQYSYACARIERHGMHDLSNGLHVRDSALKMIDFGCWHIERIDMQTIDRHVWVIWVAMSHAIGTILNMKRDDCWKIC